MKKTYPITAPTLEHAAETALELAAEDGINPAHVAMIVVEQTPGDNRPGSFDVTVQGVGQPRDTAGDKLVPNTVYRFAFPNGFGVFGIYHDAVVEDDDSLTLVVEDARGNRGGYAAAGCTVEPIVPQACGGLVEPTLQRAADGDR